MAQKSIATPTAVAEAVEKLIHAGLNPTVAQVRDVIGGGSYTTISRCLSKILARIIRERRDVAAVLPR